MMAAKSATESPPGPPRQRNNSLQESPQIQRNSNGTMTVVGNFGKFSLPKEFTGQEVDLAQLDLFLNDIARLRNAGKQVRGNKNGAFLSSDAKIERQQALIAGRQLQIPGEENETESALFSGDDDDDDEADSYSTVSEESSEEQDFEEYSRMLLEHREFQEQEEEWIRDMEQKLMNEVTDSLTTLKACQMAVQNSKESLQRDERDATRRSSAEQVIELRRASAAQIRAQSIKAEKKVKKAKARELKTRKALVQALKKQQEKKIAKDNKKKEGQRKRRQASQWDEMKKSTEDEFRSKLDTMQQVVKMFHQK